MKKLVLILAVLVVFTILPLPAQEGPPAPPKPLDNEMLKWLVGEWEGWMSTPMGSKSTEWLKFAMELDGQFLFLVGATEAQGLKYKGTGAITLERETGDAVGYWIDNFRGRYEGKGKLEGYKLVMVWDGTMGKSTRITEKISADKLGVTVKMAGPDGKMGTFKGELTRKKNK